MSNFQKIDDSVGESLEQDEMKTKLDLITISSNINLNDERTLRITNTAKNSMILGTSSSTALAGNTRIISTQEILDIQANNIKTGITNTQTSNLNNVVSAIEVDSNGDTIVKSALNKKIQFYNNDQQLFSMNDIKTLTDNISISSAINLNDEKNLRIVNTAKTGITSSQASAIVANTAKTGITSSQTSAIVANTAKTGITSSQASAIVANTAKTGITSSQTSAIVANTAKTGITSSQSTDIANAKTELSRINIQATTLLYNFLRIGSLNSEAQSFILQHSNLNSGTLANTHGSLIVDNAGNLKLNVPSSRSISFRINNVEQFNNTQIKNLVDNITISSAINLNDEQALRQINSAKTGITTSQASAITANTAKTGITSSQASAITANTAKTGITTSQATDIANNKAELNNIIIGADILNYSTGRIGKVSGTDGFSIMNSALNSGVLNDTYAGLKQSNAGKTIINGVTSNPISFRKNNVEEYSGNELKNLVDNISVSSAVNLNTMNTNITNLLNNLNDYMYVNVIHKVGSTTAVSSIINTTTTAQDLYWNTNFDTFGSSSKISWHDNDGTSASEFKTSTTGLYEITINIQAILESGATSGERYATALFFVDSDDNIIFKLYNQMSYEDGTYYNYEMVSKKWVQNLNSSKQYHFEIFSKSSGQGAISEVASGSIRNSNFLLIKKLGI